MFGINEPLALWDLGIYEAGLNNLSRRVTCGLGLLSFASLRTNPRTRIIGLGVAGTVDCSTGYRRAPRLLLSARVLGNLGKSCSHLVVHGDPGWVICTEYGSRVPARL